MSKGIKQVAIDGLTRGLATPEIIAANPDLNPKSIQCTVSRLRKELGLVVPSAKITRSMPVPGHLHEIYQREAVARNLRSGHQLSLQVLSIVAKDNLFSSIFARRYMRLSKWTVSADDLLIKLANEGKSAREIADQIPNASRNSVIGRIYRLRQLGVDLSSFGRSTQAEAARTANASLAAKARWAKVSLSHGEAL